MSATTATAITLSRAERGCHVALALATGPDRLIAATGDGTIEIWPLADLADLTTVPPARSATAVSTSAAASRTGAGGSAIALIAGSAARTAATLSTGSGAALSAASPPRRAPFLRPARAFASGLPAIDRLAVHGSLAAVAGPGAVQLHDLDRGALVRDLLVSRGARFDAIAFTPDGNHLLVACNERITTIDLVSGRVVEQAPGGERTPSIAVHPGGAIAHLACHQGGSRLVVDHLRDGAYRAGSPRTLRIPSDAATSASFSPDGTLLAFAARHVQIHRTADLSLVHAFDYWGQPVADPTSRSIDDLWSNLAFTADGRHLVAGSPLGSVIVWDLAAACPAAIHARHHEAILALALTPAGDRIFSSSRDRTLRTGRLQ